MQTMVLQGSIRQWTVEVLRGAAPFKSVDAATLEDLVDRLSLNQFEREESLFRAGDPAEWFYFSLRGAVELTVEDEGSGERLEVARLDERTFIGEVGVLLKQPHEVSAIALEQVLALRFEGRYLFKLLKRVPAFGYALSKGLADRVGLLTERTASHRFRQEQPATRDDDVLPAVFMRRHRVLPMGIDENTLTLGCVDDLEPQVINAAQQFVPGLEIVTVGIDAETFTAAMQQRFLPAFAIDESGEPTESTAVSPMSTAGRLDRLLERMTAEGASDLHLAAGHKPRWRIDGHIQEIEDSAVLGSQEVLEIMEPALGELHAQELEQSFDTDFSYTSAAGGRVRITLYRDLTGTSAAVRLIPGKIMSFRQLGLPKTLNLLCSHTNGLLLVTGPTGSGKSTTLAAMIDFINRTRATHIITIEDPIEFVHQSRRSLVNQREVGIHTPSYSRAVRAALREDPDVIMVGEMRDLETISLVLEAANTGHLVLASAHTVSAVTTVDRIVGAFPPDRQGQARVSLAEVSRGVISQVLCRRIKGGRVPACEVLVANHAIANLIQDGKTSHIPNTMTTARQEGNLLLNDALEHLVRNRIIEYEEALSKTAEKKDLARRLGRATPGRVSQPPRDPSLG